MFDKEQLSAPSFLFTYCLDATLPAQAASDPQVLPYPISDPREPPLVFMPPGYSLRLKIMPPQYAYVHLVPQDAVELLVAYNQEYAVATAACEIAIRLTGLPGRTPFTYLVLSIDLRLHGKPGQSGKAC